MFPGITKVKCPQRTFLAIVDDTSWRSVWGFFGGSILEERRMPVKREQLILE